MRDNRTTKVTPRIKKSTLAINNNETVYNQLSARAQHLLSKAEGYDVDFKRGMSGLEPEDIVAFANSPHGGTILIGIEEYNDERGQQRGKIFGCAITDQNKLAINNKANQCIPPVSVSIHIENNDTNPFFRIEIPSSDNKPHCTSGGTYKIRKDNQKRTLAPKELLQMFLEAEGTDFLKRFKEATTDLHKEINKQNSRLIDHLTSSTLDLEINTQTMIDNLSYEISEVVQDVKSQTKVLEAHTESFVETLQQETSDIKEQLESQDIAKLLKQINDNIIRTAWKSNRILEHLGLEDPEITYERNMFKGYLQAMKNISNKNSTEVSNDFFEDMYNMSNRIIKDNYTINDIKSWFDEMKPTN